MSDLVDMLDNDYLHYKQRVSMLFQWRKLIRLDLQLSVRRQRL